MEQPPAEYHSFTCLTLTISDPTLDGVRTDHKFELRSTGRGAEVWRSSVLRAAGGSCESEPRFVGSLTTRQVIELLVEIERSGVYEALPIAGLVQGEAIADQSPLVSMTLSSETVERDLLTDVPADEGSIRRAVQVVKDAIAGAQERALSFAG